MTGFGIRTDTDTLRFERLLPGPIERVWAYLTESDKRGKWLARGQMELEVGGRVELRFLHRELTPHAEPVPEKYCALENGMGFVAQVTRCEPPRLLAHSWPAGDAMSEVTYELIPRGTQVLLVLTHRRLAGKLMPSVAGGWHTHLDILADHLGRRVPKPFWSTHAALEAEYGRRLAAG